jgi:proteasome lid subunit RPN8/RPN11
MTTSIPTRPRTALHLSRTLRAEIEHSARRRYPAEACGLLLGRQEGALVEVELLHPTRNLNTARPNDRYDLDPADQLAAEEAARARGLDVVGVWHSHPDHPARPSETDRAQAWENWSYVIVSIAAGVAHDLRSWRFVDGRFLEEMVFP